MRPRGAQEAHRMPTKGLVVGMGCPKQRSAPSAAPCPTMGAPREARACAPANAASTARTHPRARRVLKVRRRRATRSACHAAGRPMLPPRTAAPTQPPRDPPPRDPPPRQLLLSLSASFSGLPGAYAARRRATPRDAVRRRATPRDAARPLTTPRGAARHSTPRRPSRPRRLRDTPAPPLAALRRPAMPP